MEKENEIEEVKKEKKKRPIYPFILGVFVLAFQHGIYLLSHNISQLMGITPFLPKIEAIDDAIKIVPIFVIPYIWSYAFWAIAPMVASKCEKQHYKDYFAAYFISVFVGGLVLIFAPTYMDRVAEGLLDVENKGFLYDLLRFWYSLDGGKMAYNLLPSFHCIMSTLSYLAVARRKEIPLWFRIYSLVMAILIYYSTMFVKQHYFLDVISGIFIASIAFIISKKFHLGKVFNKPIAYFKKKILKEEVDLPPLKENKEDE